MLSSEKPYILLEDAFGSRIVICSSPAATTAGELEPQPEDDESPLLSEEDLDELEDQVTESPDEDWEDEPDD